MIVEDFVMLRRTEPTESKKNGVAVCSAGYSRELRQLIRIYPLPWKNNIGSWTKCRIPLRRPRQDSRYESWRIDGGETAQEAVRSVQVLGVANRDEEYDVLEKMSATSIAELNGQRRSLGIIKPMAMRGSFKRREDVDPDEQLVLFDRLVADGPTHRSDLIPQLEFCDEDGPHRLSLREWGCSEYLRKHRAKADSLWSALNLQRSDYEHLLLVGNQANARTSWLVIGLISRKKRAQQSLFVEAA
jgi:hypothetical protein